jgi:hypothetical protein
MKLQYKPPYHHFVKKQPRPFALALRDETALIVQQPDIGEAKVGDLAGFRVHKFTFNRQQYLMAYRHAGNTLTFYMVGAHENFYDELKRYLKANK